MIDLELQSPLRSDKANGTAVKEIVEASGAVCPLTPMDRSQAPKQRKRLGIGTPSPARGAAAEAMLALFSVDGETLEDLSQQPMTETGSTGQSSKRSYSQLAPEDESRAAKHVALQRSSSQSQEDDIYRRKDKSLGLLCEKFLHIFGRSPCANIHLDEAAVRLGVERRRIYDIVNILESVNVMSKAEKNVYTWNGLPGMGPAIAALQEHGVPELASLSDDGQQDSAEDSEDCDSPTRSIHGQREKKVKKKVDSKRKEKSLTRLSQQFVRLFLLEKGKTITLEGAARNLMASSDCQDPDLKLLKTKIRRLYDIANVLVSINVIEKVHLPGTRKPAFRWLLDRCKKSPLGHNELATPPPAVPPKKSTTKKAKGPPCGRQEDSKDPATTLGSLTANSTDAGKMVVDESIDHHVTPVVVQAGDNAISPVFSIAQAHATPLDTAATFCRTPSKPVAKQRIGDGDGCSQLPLLEFKREGDLIAPIPPAEMLYFQTQYLNRFMDEYKDEYRAWCSAPLEERHLVLASKLGAHKQQTGEEASRNNPGEVLRSPPSRSHRHQESHCGILRELKNPASPPIIVSSTKLMRELSEAAPVRPASARAQVDTPIPQKGTLRAGIPAPLLSTGSTTKDGDGFEAPLPVKKVNFDEDEGEPKSQENSLTGQSPTSVAEIGLHITAGAPLPEL